jgi:hypothetical protein
MKNKIELAKRRYLKGKATKHDLELMIRWAKMEIYEYEKFIRHIEK